jgi:hypothetical protein
MKCTVNENNEITGFWDNDSNAPSTAVSCDAIHSTHSHINNEGIEKFNYKLISGVVTITADGTAYNNLNYSRLRKAKYDLLNQDEMRYDDVKNSTTTWVDAIDAIKVAHPKGDS